MKFNHLSFIGDKLFSMSDMDADTTEYNDYVQQFVKGELGKDSYDTMLLTAFERVVYDKLNSDGSDIVNLVLERKCKNLIF